jgi:hypothetical protein
MPIDIIEYLGAVETLLHKKLFYPDYQRPGGFELQKVPKQVQKKI